MKLFKIEENDANQRLDKFLKKLFPSATRSLIYKFNRKDKIKIKFEWSEWKYRKRDNEYKIQEGDEIKIFLSDDDFDELTSPQASSVGEEVKGEKFHKENIAYEDEDLFIVNKNSGINVHPWDFKTKEISLIAQVQDYLWDTLNSLTFKPSLIHRIDRDTSGILMIAKKKDILVKLVNDFKSHTKVKKTYYAIVLGKLSRTSWSITKKLLRIENARNEAKVQVSEKGQTAITHYKLLAEHTLQTKEWIVILSEVEVKIETWRMHQIRVHMASIGNPIIWDKSYWDKKMNSFMMRQYGLSRQALHAWKIEFFHYAKNKNMEITASLKKDLAQFITNIQK